MEQRVLKWCAIWVGVLTLVVGVGVWFLPKLHERSVQVRERNLSGGEWITFVRPERILSEEAFGKDYQLRIDLPKNVTADDIEIMNDYRNRCIYLSFPTDSSDYFADYDVNWDGTQIEEMYYSQNDGVGQVVFLLDHVYEPQFVVEEHACYMNFQKPKDVFTYVVVVDAGHGGRAGGATRAGYNEKDINLAIVEQLQMLLDDPNVGVYYTRLDDSNPSLEERVGLANELEADLFLSVHCNTTSKGHYSKTHGTMAMYYADDGANSKLSSESKAFAKSCRDLVTEQTGGKSLTNRSGNSLYIIRNSKVPATLVEVGFMSNKDELNDLVDENYQALIAKGLYEAIMTSLEE